jgi:hypothetical protein
MEVPLGIVLIRPLSWIVSPVEEVVTPVVVEGDVVKGANFTIPSANADKGEINKVRATAALTTFFFISKTLRHFLEKKFLTHS